MQASWAIVLGASSGFGLATAHKLARHGFHIAAVHRDRRGAMARIEREFAAVREHGVRLVSFNRDALNPDDRAVILRTLADQMGPGERVRVLLHSIAFGNLRPLMRGPSRPGRDAVEALAREVGVSPARLRDAARRLFLDEDLPSLYSLVEPAEPQLDAPPLADEDFARTVQAMGTSLAGWTCAVLDAGLFADGAAVIGLTSEGNAIAWPGYAAVAAAKAALEAVARALAVEGGSRGLRVNILQPGVTDTPALRHIPGHRAIRARALLRNPSGRLTRPEDVANVVYLLTLPEAAWINGALIRVDGGEAVSGMA